mmetsp:Transcript_838/g.2020  ORF Transcript_838/g.2020 Transcript_838/m.2020 type:complete len:91 (-) Transcript_838:44-316(-)
MATDSTRIPLATSSSTVTSTAYDVTSEALVQRLTDGKELGFPVIPAAANREQGKFGFRSLAGDKDCFSFSPELLSSVCCCIFVENLPNSC